MLTYIKAKVQTPPNLSIVCLMLTSPKELTATHKVSYFRDSDILLAKANPDSHYSLMIINKLVAYVLKIIHQSDS